MSINSWTDQYSSGYMDTNTGQEVVSPIASNSSLGSNLSQKLGRKILSTGANYHPIKLDLVDSKTKENFVSNKTTDIFTYYALFGILIIIFFIYKLA